MQSRGAPDCTFVDDAPKDALMDLHKNAQKGVCEVSLKGCTSYCIWVAPVIAFVDAMIKAQMSTNWLSNGGSDAVLEGVDDAVPVWRCTWWCTRRCTWWWT